MPMLNLRVRFHVCSVLSLLLTKLLKSDRPSRSDRGSECRVVLREEMGVDAGATLVQSPVKEVIQPQVPLRLPCYDFTPVIDHTVGGASLPVQLPPSGAANSHGVTGGVYKARERIHRGMADPRLLAIPTSRSRVADSDPDCERLFEIGSASRLGYPLYRPL